MEINLTDDKCIITINDYYEDIIITSSDPTLLNLLNFMQKESILIDSIENSHSDYLGIIVSELTYAQLLLIEQILGNITIYSYQDIRCNSFLKIVFQCDYSKERFGYYED